jgi:hypothetical protein
MKNIKFIGILLIGIITGWFLPDCHSPQGSNSITIHDTLKTTSVQYKLLPGADYNIDSLITVINEFWKDSLKNLYGKGLFEAKYSKEDELGKREYTLASRIPIDPESSLIVDENFNFPKKTFTLVGSIGCSTALYLKYYLHDSPKLSFSGQVGYEYLIAVKNWNCNARFELEYKF